MIRACGLNKGDSASLYRTMHQQDLVLLLRQNIRDDAAYENES